MKISPFFRRNARRFINRTSRCLTSYAQTNPDNPRRVRPHPRLRRRSSFAERRR